MAMGFYVIAVVYPILRIWGWYQPSDLFATALSTLAMVVFIGIPLGLFLTRFVLRLRMPERLMPWLYSIVGCCFLMFPVVITLEIVRWVPGFPQGFESPTAIAGALLLTVYALLNAQRVQIRTVRIGDEPHAAGCSIVQLSDIHIGSRSTNYLDRIVDKVVRLDPSWVVITGDLLDSSNVGVAELAPLRRIANRTLMVTGNHERYEGIERVTTMLESLGITVLRNEEKEAKPFQFVGIDDHDSPTILESQLRLFNPAENAYRVLLYHRPHGMAHAAAWGFDLMLVGHTHRGQIFPFRFVVKRFFEKTHGTHRFGDMTLHISTGTGTWGPVLRLGSRNEITHFVFT